MKNPPKGWPRISAAVFYDDAPRAIAFLRDAFGFEVRLRVDGEGGRVEHSELCFGEGLVMVASVGPRADRKAPLPCRSPRSIGGAVTQALCIAVDDVDAHCEAARAAGATIAEEPKTTDHGPEYWADRTYRAIDPEGHHWWFLQRVREPA